MNDDLNTLICDDCDLAKPSVQETTCPFEKELTGEEVEATLCRAYYHERCMDI